VINSGFGSWSGLPCSVVIEAARSYETLVSYHITTWCPNPEITT